MGFSSDLIVKNTDFAHQDVMDLSWNQPMGLFFSVKIPLLKKVREDDQLNPLDLGHPIEHLENFCGAQSWFAQQSLFINTSLALTKKKNEHVCT